MQKQAALNQSPDMVKMSACNIEEWRNSEEGLINIKLKTNNET
jgi:hypothetical protein